MNPSGEKSKSKESRMASEIRKVRIMQETVQIHKEAAMSVLQDGIRKGLMPSVQEYVNNDDDNKKVNLFTETLASSVYLQTLPTITKAIQAYTDTARVKERERRSPKLAIAPPSSSSSSASSSTGTGSLDTTNLAALISDGIKQGLAPVIRTIT